MVPKGGNTRTLIRGVNSGESKHRLFVSGAGFKLFNTFHTESPNNANLNG